MRSRISRRLLPLILVLLSVMILGATLPAEGKGGFCPGACSERLDSWDSFDSVTFE